MPEQAKEWKIFELNKQILESGSILVILRIRSTLDS
tara:strand:+ start:153280 stop:153387 length:108 start_codon:yes stop_codon:yes gene_type:complete